MWFKEHDQIIATSNFNNFIECTADWIFVNSVFLHNSGKFALIPKSLSDKPSDQFKMFHFTTNNPTEPSSWKYCGIVDFNTAVEKIKHLLSDNPVLFNTNLPL